MKCLLKYQWVKLPRDLIPQGKGIMGSWARLASRAAFRSGKAKYCGHINEVNVGSWAGGVVGLKSIFGEKSRAKTLAVMDQLCALGYVSYTLDAKTKKLEYKINDWVVECSGAECMDGAITAPVPSAAASGPAARPRAARCHRSAWWPCPPITPSERRSK